MRNKRTLQRGLALLLAGGMALSNLGAAPVLAEEYGTATEVTQAAPDGEAATDTTTNGDTDLSEGSESASPTEEKLILPALPPRTPPPQSPTMRRPLPRKRPTQRPPPTKRPTPTTRTPLTKKSPQGMPTATTRKAPTKIPWRTPTQIIAPTYSMWTKSMKLPPMRQTPRKQLPMG